MTRLITLGLDGAAWHKLDRLMDEGRLPNLERLVEEGAHGTLRSVYPPVTCPAWRCSTSGKNPGKLGVFWWLNLERKTGDLRTPDANSFDTADVWDYLSDEGYESAILNVPMTYPPSQIDGAMVSGFGAPFEFDVDEVVTHPPEFQQYLDAKHGWQIGVEDVTAPGGAEEALDLIESRFELLFDLLEEGYDYLHLTVFYINVLQHKFGDGPETNRAWERIDEYIGELPDDVTKILYSDHGHSRIDRTFVLNKYLIDRDYLKFESGTGANLTGGLYSALKRAGVSPRRIASVAKQVVPRTLFERIIESGYPVPTSAVADRVDWHESKALAVSQGPVFCNSTLLGDDYGEFRASLRDELTSLTVDSQAPFCEVRTAEDVYTGDHLDQGPDLMITARDGWEIYGGITPKIVEFQATSWTSGNHPEGMVLLHGPDVESGSLPEQWLPDVMPTVLRYMGCPVPVDIDGTAMETAFTDLPHTGERDPLEPADVHGNVELEQRLEDLGYLE